MPGFKVTLDVSQLREAMEAFKGEVVRDIQKGIEGVAKATHVHIVERVQNQLHSYRDQYLSDLSAPEQLDENLWVITLQDTSAWIEEGRPEPYDMKPGLLNTTSKKAKSGPKTSKDGHRYRIVPMNQAKTATQMSPNTAGYEQNMVNLVKATLKKKGIPYKKLELNEQGSPRIGKLHSMDINSPIPGKGNTPQLHGLSIYQHKQKDGSVKRSIMTFRTVTDQPNQADKWIHPPVEGKEFFRLAADFAEREWEQNWLPKILEKYK